MNAKTFEEIKNEANLIYFQNILLGETIEWVKTKWCEILKKNIMKIKIRLEVPDQ